MFRVQGGRGECFPRRGVTMKTCQRCELIATHDLDGLLLCTGDYVTERARMDAQQAIRDALAGERFDAIRPIINGRAVQS